MNKKDLVKSVGGFIISTGVSSVVGDIIASNVRQPKNILMKSCVLIGSVVLSNYVADKTVDYAEEKFDELTKDLNNNVEIVEG